MTGSFHISLFEGTLHVDKIHGRFKIAKMRMRYTETCGRFALHDTVLRFLTGVTISPRYNTGVNSRRGDSRRHEILWWYHVNKCRAMGGNRCELTPERKSPRCHVNTP